MDALLPIDLLGDNVERLIPADAHVTGFAAILWIAFAIGIKIHPLHRVKNAFVGINERFERQRVRRHRATTLGPKRLAPCLDLPARRVIIRKIDGCYAQNAPIFDVYENRPAIGAGCKAVTAVGHGRAHRQRDRLAHVQRLIEPDHQLVFALSHHFEIFCRMNNFAWIRVGQKKCYFSGL